VAIRREEVVKALDVGWTTLMGEKAVVEVARRVRAAAMSFMVAPVMKILRI
jgi:hypothetical protein